MQVITHNQVGGRCQQFDVFGRKIPDQISHPMRKSQLGEKRKAPLISAGLRKTHDLDPRRAQQDLHNGRFFSRDDERSIDPALLQLFGCQQAGKGDQMIAGLDFVGTQHLLGQQTHARALLANRDAFSLQLGQPGQCLFATIKDPDRFIENAAKR